MARLHITAIALLVFSCTTLQAADAPETTNPLKASALTPTPIEYRPSMPDMMNIAVQPQHAKLVVAGRERNWKYLAYEILELRGAFTKIARTAPAHDGWDTQAMFTAMIMTPIQYVEDAIKAQDGRAFDRTTQR